MRTWAVTMVRDELDILPHTLAHLANEGIDGIIVADNRSTDGTREWLHEAVLDCELIVVHDEEIGYYQSRKMTRLAHQAFGQGANWVIPFDADEFWHLPTHQPLTFSLAQHGADAVSAQLYNYFPTSNDGNEPNPFERIQHRDIHPAPLTKVAVASNPTVSIEQGNHGASGAEPFLVSPSTITVAHFPWRTPEQFVRKVANGYEAYQATDLGDDVGSHWRDYGDLLKREGDQALHALFNKWFRDPPGPIEHRPVPWLRSYPGAT